MKEKKKSGFLEGEKVVCFFLFQKDSFKYQ